MKTRSKLVSFLIGALLTVSTVGGFSPGSEPSPSEGIDVYSDNPFYWQYDGEPTLLLGASDDDNLIQHKEMEAQIDSLVQAGGNYIRNTMSSRSEGDLWPFATADNGQYDLTQWNSAYWDRFERFLQYTAEKDVVVQVEIWATWDFYRSEGGWAEHPFNPKNNVNYTAEASGLPDSIDYFPFAKIQPFFNTIPALQDNERLIQHQQAFVDKLLSHTLDYDHVLYCMNNETSADPRWGAYWAEYVREQAQAQGESVHLTDMFDDWDPADGRVEGARVQDSTTHPYLDRASTMYTVRHPELYSFVDLSNHNVQTGETHYRTALYVRNQVRESGSVRPITSVKIYGGVGDTGFDGTYADGQERFWRNVFAGVSAVRFHRPDAGIGLDSVSLAHVQSMRMLTDSLHIFDTGPCTDLLGDRSSNEAYCLGEQGSKYAVYFPNGGTVTLPVPQESNDWTIQWLDIRNHEWQPPTSTDSTDRLSVSTPRKGHWVAWIRSGD